MSETAKTLAFIVIGAAALLAAYLVDRPTQAVNVETLVGQTLNADIEVDEPKRLKIVKFDRETASTRQFEVAALEGGWSIPSKQDYPADATEQMAAAANALIDRKILRVAGQSADSHVQYGVVDPMASSLSSNSVGVGTRVIMTGADDQELVDMIIGKKVKDAEGQRYVRKTNQDVVYVVELDPESLSTNFDDWIEDDLLKLSPFDIRRVFINDYSADLGFGMTAQGQIVPRVSWERRGEFTLTYDNADAKWNLAELKKFDPQTSTMVEDKLAADEEVNQEALTELRNGLDDLLIVDVARKPEGLSGDLKAGKEFFNNREAFEDLVDKGFSPVALKEGADREILSSEGEIICTQRDGVEYVLRFGKLQVQTETADDGQDPATEGEAAAGEPADEGEPASAGGPDEKKPVDEEGKNLRRYLFVMARFNEDIIEKPKLKELPALPEGAEEPAEKTDEEPAGEPASGEPASAGGDPPPSAADEAPPAEEPAPPAGGDEPAAADQPEPTDETSPDDAGKEEAPEEKPSADEPATGEPASAGGDPEKAPETSEADKIAAERKAIEEENQRLQDEYQETVEGGKKKVAELNERFGDWYYVISNDVYKQIHLGRSQIIKKKEKPAESAEAAATDESNPLSGLPTLPPSGAPAAQPAEGDAVEK